MKFTDTLPESAAGATTSELASWLAVLVEPGRSFEVAHLPRWNSGRVSRVFTHDTIDEAARYAASKSKTAVSVYFTLNPVRPDLKGSAKDEDIVHRALLLIDSDPNRPADTSSTDDEKAAALERILAVRAFLAEQGWPDGILADSGNGYHSLHRIDLPNDDESKVLVERTLKALAVRFSTPAVKIDTTVSNASRICKLYGTKARKGKHSAERPHRFSRVLETPAEFTTVAVEQLRAVAASGQPEQTKFDLDAEIERKRGQEPPRPEKARADSWELEAKMAPSLEERVIAYISQCEPAISGQGGHKAAYKAACKVGPGFDLPPETAFRLLWEHYNPRCQPEWSEKELRHKVADAYKDPKNAVRGWLKDGTRKPSNNGTGGKGPGKRAGVDKDPPIHRTDLGNAVRMVRKYGHLIRYNAKHKIWMVWDGTRWREDETGAIYRMAKRTVREIAFEAAEAKDDDEAKAILRWALASEAKKHIDAMIGLAWSEKGLAIEPNDFDRDPWLLNCLNGTIDLRTGELRPHRREDMISKIAPVEYDPDAKCDLWLKSLSRITGDDKELAGFIQRALGYGISGSISEHALFLLYGTGRNGKSTVLDTILTLVGDYGTTINTEALIQTRNEQHPTALCDLEGRRFVPTDEIENGRRAAEALVKKLTGGSRVKARRMRKDFYEFDPTHKIFLAANHKPEIKGTDEGIWSRIKLIPFSVFIPPEERIKDLVKKLVAEEGPGILAWLVRGCIEWQMKGLAEPKVIKDATSSYRNEMDMIGDFVTQCCNCFLKHTTLRDQAKEKASTLYHAFAAWGKENGFDVPVSREFGSEMEKRGYRLHKSNGNCYRLGIQLKAADAKQDPKQGKGNPFKTEANGYSEQPF